MSCGNSCEVPCWSGLWLETDEIGYMEVSDLDERTHRAPPGWTLVDVKENVIRSSQIFRYVKVPVPVRVSRILGSPGALVGALLSGAALVGLPFVRALLEIGAPVL